MTGQDPRLAFQSYQNPHIPQDDEPIEYYVGTIYERFKELRSGNYSSIRTSDGSVVLPTAPVGQGH